MANRMKLIAKRFFPKSIQVTDRFHVQKRCLETLQEVKRKHRREDLDEQSEGIAKAKEKTYNSSQSVRQI